MPGAIAEEVLVRLFSVHISGAALPSPTVCVY
jgi:hypothetical protein